MRSINEEDGSFTGRQRATDFIAKVNVARRVNQVQHVIVEVHPDVLRLDGDAPLTLNIHRVEILRSHEPRVDRTSQFQDAVRQGGLAVVDVGDN